MILNFWKIYKNIKMHVKMTLISEIFFYWIVFYLSKIMLYKNHVILLYKNKKTKKNHKSQFNRSFEKKILFSLIFTNLY